MTTLSTTESSRLLLAQSRELSRLAVMRFVRQPTTWIPGLFFPLILMAVNSSAMGRIAQVPGLLPPGTTFLQYLLPAAILQGVMFGSIAGGAEMARDIQTGFFERLVSSPVARPAIVVGRLAGSVAFGAFAAVLFQLLAWPFGASVAGGLAGRLVLVVTAMVLSLGVGGLAAGLAARTGQEETVQGFFPLVFIMLFVSSCFFPIELMSGWYKTVAEYNPLTFMADGMRYQVLYGFSWSEAGKAIGVAAILAVLGVWFASSQVRYRIRMA